MASIFNKVKGNYLTAVRSCILNTQRTAARDSLKHNHKVNNLEKRFLVWTGKYKNIEAVPEYVDQNVMERARNRMRIRIANYMIFATAIACGVMIYLGKRDAKRGESVTKQNMEWHRRVNEGKESV